MSVLHCFERFSRILGCTEAAVAQLGRAGQEDEELLHMLGSAVTGLCPRESYGCGTLRFVPARQVQKLRQLCFRWLLRMNSVT